MNYINYDDALRQLEAAGLVIDTAKLTIDGRIQRWKTNDSRGGDKPGWTRLKEWQSKGGNIYIVGAFGVWMGNDDGYTKIELPKKDDPDRPALTKEDFDAMRAAQKAAAQAVAEERKREAKTAAGWAAQIWHKATPAEQHEYLTRKGIGPNGTRILGDLDGLVLTGVDDANWWRLTKSVGALVVPMHDTNGNIAGLQFIFPKGHEFEGKQFWPTGMAMGGTFGVIGGLRRSGVLLATEGFATAASLHEATGQPVAYTFSANNLGKAGKQIRTKYKQLRILFCADDDYLTEQKTGTNPGVSAALQAASEIELAAWTKPDFTDEAGNDIRAGKKLSDYNDLAVLTGLPLVLANQINAKLDALKWRDAIAATGAPSQGGGGNDGRPDAVAVMSLDDAVARFIPIDDGRGKVMFDTWTNKLCLREQMISILPAGVRGDDVKRHPVYISRGAYYLDQIGFDPTESDRYVKLNTWAGWPMKPKAGDCQPFLELIEQQCSDERNSREIYHYLLDWMAYPLQNAGAKMNTAIIMHGPQGTGKSMIFKALAQIYGKGHPFRDYSVVLDQRALQDNFNADWENKLFVLAEEVVNSSDKWLLKNELKELVTGDRLRIRKVFTDAYYQKNQLNMVFLSNEGQPLPLDHDDRRHLVVWTPPQKEAAYYKNVQRCLDNGGLEAFYHFLMARDLSAFNPKDRPPNTAAKEELIYQSAPTDARFIADWKAGMLDVPFCPCGSEDLYEVYVHWCRRNGERFVIPQNRFFGFVRMSPGWKKGVYRTHAAEYDHKQSKSRRLIVPSEADLSKAAKESGKDHRQETAETEVEWLSRSYFAFNKAADAARLTRSPMREAA